jgi:DNA-binding PadR family transcriptional regulator
MCKLRNRTMSGYMARSYIHKNYDYLVSLGTVYSVLYSLERRKLIKGNMKTKKRMFELTTKGEEMIESILVADKGLLGLVKNLINAV